MYESNIQIRFSLFSFESQESFRKVNSESVTSRYHMITHQDPKNLLGQNLETKGYKWICLTDILHS